MTEIVRLKPGEGPPGDGPYYLVEVSRGLRATIRHASGITHLTTPEDLEFDIQHHARKAEERGMSRLYVQGSL